MARALSLRQLARNFQKQADAASRLAKLQNTAALALPQSGQASADELMAALRAYDVSIRTFYQSEGFQEQANAYTAKADEAFAAGDASEAP